MANSTFLIGSLFFLISLSSFAQGTSNPTFYDQGKEAYDQGDFRKAEGLFLKNLTFQDSSSKATEKEKTVAQLWMGDVYRAQRIFGKALPYYETAIQQAKTADLKELYLSACQNRAYLYSKMYKPIKAINEFKRLLPIAAQLYGKESRGYAGLVMNLGIDYFKMGDYYQANQQFLQALAIFQKTEQPTSQAFNRIYSNMGVNYRKMGMYQKAIEYGEKALKIKLLNYPPDHPSVAKYHLNIGRVYRDMHEPAKALPYLEKGLEIQQIRFPSNHPFVTGMKGEVANVLADLGRYEEALTYYRTSETVDPKYMDSQHPYIVAAYANIAQVYLETERYEEALAIQQKAINLIENRAYVPPYKRTQMLLLLSRIFKEKGDLKQAQAVAFEGLSKLLEKEISDQDLPSPEHVQDKRLYIELIDWIASLYEHEGSFSKAFEASSHAITAILLLRSSYHSAQDRQYLNAEMEGIFARAIRLAFALHNQTSENRYLLLAFEYIEAAKADVLKHAFNEGLALRSAGIPPALLDSLDDLTFKIGGIEDDLNDRLTYGQDEKSTSVTDSLKTQLFQLRQDYEAFIGFLKQTYPKYHQLAFGGISMNVSHLQKRLLKKQMSLLSYFYDDEQVYGILLTANDMYGFQQAHQGKLLDQITSFRQYLSPKAALDAGEVALHAFQRLQDSLYTFLLKGLEKKKKLSSVQSLLIIPYGALHYFPFEILYTPGGDNRAFKTCPFLLKKFPIHYANAASIWAQEIHEKNSPSVSYAGFAPSYDEMPQRYAARTGFATLNWNVDEVIAAQRLYKGEIFTGNSASEEAFRKIASKAGILHLSMHADVNDRQPMQSGLLFTPGSDSMENGFLNLYEIYNQQISAHTLVLNACNTGFGKLAEGEGVMSLSHAFAYAGCQSMLLNLWLADDQAASQIVTAFYGFLKEGLPKDEALREAKLRYLAEADPLRAHPYFWAGLVLKGKTQVNTSSFELRSIGFWAVWVLVLVLGGILWRKKVRSLPNFPGIFSNK